MQGIYKRIISGALAAAMLLPSAGLCTSADTADYSQTAIVLSANAKDVRAVINSSYSGTASSVTIKWDRINGAAGYRVYRLNNKTGKYEKIKTLYGDDDVKYKNSGLAANTQYTYKVRAFFKSKGVTTWGKMSLAKQTTTSPSAAPKLKSAALTANGGLKLKWGKVDCAGYEVYIYSRYSGKWVMLQRYEGGTRTSAIVYPSSWEYGGLTGYKMMVRAFSTDANNGRRRTAASNDITYYDINTISEYMGYDMSRLGDPTKSSGTSYQLYNTQGKKTTKSAVYMTAADKAALKEFAKEHFESGWSPAQKAAYTLNWINKNVEYASGDKYYKIAAKGYADAIFNEKLGQCIQYNGAMVEMLVYLGYDAHLVQGYRGRSVDNKWQHFWGEITINKKNYVIEAGNYESDGEWWYLCTPYSQAGGYIKNDKVVTK